MIVDGKMQNLETEFSVATAPSAVAASGNLLKTRHDLDAEMQEIDGVRMLIVQHGWCRVQVAPATETGTAQDAAEALHPSPAGESVR